MIGLFLRIVFAALLLGLAAPASVAVQPDEVLKDPQLEARARALSAELRCLVCQNQSIDDSDAPLARDLRLLVRVRLSAGDSDSQVIRYLVDRYGEFVLLRPPLGARTYLLWVAPLLIFIAGLMLARNLFRRSAATGVAPGPSALTPEEERRLRDVLQSGTESRRIE
jgi:cytochrome c-type biogenesis protein CcmH